MRIVKDILIEIQSCKVIFLLESPYKDELIHNHPLAGKSGITATTYIYNATEHLIPDNHKNVPLGCILIRQDSQISKKIGVMNCSEFPLDKICYSCVDSQKENINAFDFIRRNPKPKNRRDLNQGEIVNVL